MADLASSASTVLPTFDVDGKHQPVKLLSQNSCEDEENGNLPYAYSCLHHLFRHIGSDWSERQYEGNAHKKSDLGAINSPFTTCPMPS